MILKVHVPDAPSYDVGDEIRQESLAEAIRAEAEIIAEDAGSDVLPGGAREELQDRITRDMTAALLHVGDTYRGPDGVRYSLVDPQELDLSGDEGRLDTVSAPEPRVEEVLRFEDLPPGSMANRRAVVRWSDGSESEAIRYYAERS
jgi:hypothetical protein